MEFSNSFEVSLSPEKAWPWLMDVESIIPCMPGAELIEKHEDGSFKGKISVRLGPVSLLFVCDARFDEIDNEQRRAKITAVGADAKGRGSANAGIDFWLQPSAVGSKVMIDTQLELSGAVAQYGRGAGLIQNVANQIVSQFARNLEARIAQLKEHAELSGTDVFAAQPAGSDETATPPATPASTSAAMVSPRPAGGADAQAYAEGFKDGYADGFGTGHSAGFLAGQQLALQRPGSVRPDGLPPFPSTKPINGLSLFFSSLGNTITGWFSRRPR